MDKAILRYCSGLVVVALALPAAYAGVVFQDSFTNITTLNGRAPDTVNAFNSQWSVHASTSTGGNSTITTSLGAASPAVSGGKLNFYGQSGTTSSSGNVTAGFAYTPTSGSAKLSLSVTINAIQGSWAGFGFTTADVTQADPWRSSSIPWLFVGSSLTSTGATNSTAGQVNLLLAGGVNSTGQVIGTPYLSAGEHVITLTYNGATNVVEVYVDGGTLPYLSGVLASSVNITGIFLVNRSGSVSSSTTVATFDNVTLDDSGYTVPEPATLGLMVPSILSLAGCLRRSTR